MTGAGPRVLHLSTERGFRGGERQVALLVSGLAAGNLTQVVAAPAGARLTQAVRQPNVTVRTLAERAYHPLNLVRLVRTVQKLGPATIVHTHTSPALTLASLVCRWTPDARILHTRRVAFPLRRTAKYRTTADHYVAISMAIADQLRRGGIDHDRLEVIYSGIDVNALDRAQNQPTDLEVESASELVVCTASLTLEKGHSVLLDAWQVVARQRPQARLVLLGDGPLRPALERLAGPNVRLIGNSDQVASWLRIADLYVQPSLAEGLGTATLEAMGCTVPVVASATGGLPEVVVDGFTGLLVPPGRPDELATAISTLLNDPDRRAQMGSAGRERVVQHFSVDRLVSRYRAAYEQLSSTRRTSRRPPHRIVV